MTQSSIRVLQTTEHRCGYYADRNARNLVIDPEADNLDAIYDAVSAAGFRRAGNLLFRPHCRSCQACVATRIPVEGFKPNRSQRRCARRNTDLNISMAPAVYRDEYFDLYFRYLAARHPAGGMDNPNREDFEAFLLSHWCHTAFIELRLDKKLIGVAVTDRLASGLSAVYSFHEPEMSERGLGTFSILVQLEQAAVLGLPFVYLGYWLANHSKMDYKIHFRPIELFVDGQWAPHRPTV